jgi:hypothetical protein
MLEKEKIAFEDDLEFEIENKNSDYIAAAFNSLAAVDLLDTGLMNENDKEVVNTIKYQAILIISESINNIFNEIFDTTINDDDDLVL